MGVGSALEPLYLAYLRRLEEMAARVPAEALLRESTTCNPDGSVTLGRDGLPLIFDVADKSTRETYEVRGAVADEPRVAAGRVGAVEVAFARGNWEALPVACVFEQPPSRRDLSELADLIRSWALLAAQGGFSRLGGEPRLPWTGRLHSLRVEVEGATMTAVLDLGTCPPAALEVLVLALDGFGRDRCSIAQVAIGVDAMAVR